MSTELPNRLYNSIVKPIVRFLKAWNAAQNYPYNPFDLESRIVDMNFNSDSYATGFFYAIENLPTFSLPSVASKKVEVLQKNADWIRTYLSREDLVKAKDVVRRIIPTKIVI